MLRIEPVTLEGHLVRLEPLGTHHVEQLFEAGKYEEIWTYMSFVITNAEDAQRFSILGQEWPDVDRKLRSRFQTL